MSGKEPTLRYAPREPDVFLVICREDRKANGKPGDYALATRRIFPDAKSARDWAKGINRARSPLVVSGDFHHLHARSRGFELSGRGDARLADYMDKLGFHEIGLGRTYETMVFALNGKVCIDPECGCGMPEIVPSELLAEGYNLAGDATRGHFDACWKVALGEVRKS